MKKFYSDDSINKISDSLLGDIFHNERIDICTDALNKIAPALLSSLFTIFSIISSSFVYDFSPFLNGSWVIIGMFFFVGLSYYAVWGIVSKIWRIIGFEGERNVEESENNKGASNIMDFSIKRIYANNLIKSIKSTLSELCELVFVIIFPGGVSDILIGFAENSQKIGLNGTNQIWEGIILVSFSILSLSAIIVRQVKVSKHNSVKRRKEMRTYMSLIIEKLEKDPYVKILFDNDQDSMN
ncbi:MAG: hypothetical protein M1477_00845 [Candidatus Thermoplasmatota archaeon]|nr:hypothetical protein [Candidatus Thermoplasmatota archaeon]